MALSCMIRDLGPVLDDPYPKTRATGGTCSPVATAAGQYTGLRARQDAAKGRRCTRCPHTSSRSLEAPSELGVVLDGVFEGVGIQQILPAHVYVIVIKAIAGTRVSESDKCVILRSRF